MVQRLTMQLIPPHKCAHRARLPQKGKELYDAMAAAMVRRERSVTVGGRYPGRVTEVFEALLHDQPFLFDLRREQVSVSTCDNCTRIGWDYYLTDAQYDGHRTRIYAALRRLQARIPREGRALRREWEIHKLMQRMALRTPAEDDELPWWHFTIAGPLLYGETVCEGAAMLFFLLCLLEGVPCQVVTGKSCGVHHKGGPHAWNLVCLGAQPMHVDVYWDMCLYDETIGCSYDYFNLPDSRMRADHVWNAQDCPPAATQRYSWFAMKACDVFGLEGFRQLLMHCADGRAQARFEVLPTDEEIRQAALETLLAQGGSIVWRKNEDQRVIALAVTCA